MFKFPTPDALLPDLDDPSGGHIELRGVCITSSCVPTGHAGSFQGYQQKRRGESFSARGGSVDEMLFGSCEWAASCGEQTSLKPLG